MELESPNFTPHLSILVGLPDPLGEARASQPGAYPPRATIMWRYLETLVVMHSMLATLFNPSREYSS